MKKTNYFFALFILTLTIASCTNDSDLTTNDATQAGDVRISARRTTSSTKDITVNNRLRVENYVSNARN